jgi:hypothetical protein
MLLTIGYVYLPLLLPKPSIRLWLLRLSLQWNAQTHNRHWLLIYTMKPTSTTAVVAIANLVNILLKLLQTYFSRKKNYSLNCMLVVNSAEEVIYYSVGSPGSYHDARVLRRTDLVEKLSTLPAQYHLLGKLVVICDSCVFFFHCMSVVASAHPEWGT